jgi:SAM-dependent methyltransferase
MPSHATSTADVEKGAAIYDGRTLRVYDLVVHGISNRVAWRCPTQALLELYDRHVSATHLDVGVGSGYFLDRCRFPSKQPRVSLLDLNRDALAFAAERIRRYSPVLHVGNVLEPVPLPEAPFGSIALMYLLHCVPGDLAAKAVVFDHLGKLLSSEGVLFGATILGSNAEHSLPARFLMRLYNNRQIFGNQADTLRDLETSLDARFRKFNVDVKGSVALFTASGYRG